MPSINILAMNGVSKTLKDVPLFESVSFGMDAGEKAGVIGTNGTGKSTLLKLIGGLMQSDTGTIAKSREIQIGYLPQEVHYKPNDTVMDFFLAETHPSIMLLSRYVEALRTGDNDLLTTLLLHIEHTGAWNMQSSFISLLDELDGPDQDEKMAVLSGGMQKKAALARVLATNSNLLLLDEPTNHLDIRTIEWLENYLISMQAACIFVSHDRYLLDTVCTTILEIDNKRLYHYPAGYQRYLEMRQQRLDAHQQYQQKLQVILKKELEWMQHRPKARTGKDTGRIKRISQMQLQVTNGSKGAQTEFSSVHRRLGKKILELQDITKSFDGRVVLQPFSHTFSKHDRIGIVGPNGSGKTTFFDVIAGRLESDSGSVDVGVNTVFGYYDQLERDMNRNQIVIEYIEEIAQRFFIGSQQELTASQFLEHFGFEQSFHRIPIGMLSGGERRRLALIGILAHAPNFLLLDEPTNDLDLDTLSRFEEYLKNFNGCMLVISHDRAFLDKVTTMTFAFDADGAITAFAGSYGECSEEIKEYASTSTVRDTGSKEHKRTDVPKRMNARPTFAQKKEYAEIETKIAELESERETLEMEFGSATVDVTQLGELSKRYQYVNDMLDDLMIRWEELAILID
ncbi:MAG: ABC-F family ATP-binding cassette domain-containing protein [Sphaerochaetaceae bacterium]|jgi:ATP-binding cassette subfamily F protein uup|nr:ABC-F family ATP-binding cassette domain-containing protein [Sphaerochaetaceae bacterium]MDD4260138.1 ABC-F family ATP-binding cassette domain-containing protein [Sphaerochaetaceae bacterium]MDD4840699.1 ABC-F family ATP-binding cassette domain-containing protein [Sphaerochaetaceae bacterium]MDD5075605.1 ABC-F family ATP-binding cassette domain-containing protein [Sphaerochaetaceae bacterium]